MHGVPTRVIVVDESDPTFPCENCGRPSYKHKLLSKEDEDWCLDCNDEHYKKGWSDKQMVEWSIEEMKKGKAITVVTKLD